MTWGEWIDSEYNTIGLYYDSNEFIYSSSRRFLKSSDTCILVTNKIIDDITYKFSSTPCET